MERIASFIESRRPSAAGLMMSRLVELQLLVGSETVKGALDVKVGELQAGNGT